MNAYQAHPDVTKAAFVAMLEWHATQDMILQGTYGDSSEGGDFRGCAVGCSLNSVHAGYVAIRLRRRRRRRHFGNTSTPRSDGATRGCQAIRRHEYARWRRKRQRAAERANTQRDILA